MVLVGSAVLAAKTGNRAADSAPKVGGGVADTVTFGGTIQMDAADGATAPQYAVMPDCIARAPVTLIPDIAPIMAALAADVAPEAQGTPATEAP